ncbi:Threonine deaminase, partial [human gut metagenome]
LFRSGPVTHAGPARPAPVRHGYPGRVNELGSNGTTWDSARYLREVLRAPVYEAAQHTPLQVMTGGNGSAGGKVPR